jgi:hypothetical protein
LRYVALDYGHYPDQFKEIFQRELEELIAMGILLFLIPSTWNALKSKRQRVYWHVRCGLQGYSKPISLFFSS